MSAVQVLAPVSGRVVALEDVPDPVFAQKMLGDGLAVDPTEEVAVAPVAGKIVILHRAGHAYAVQASEAVTVVVHLGIDTVTMEGTGFTPVAQIQDQVDAGQPIIRFSLEAIRSAGHSPIVPVITTDLPEAYRVEQKTNAAEVRAGEDALFTVIGPD